jgi:hypothetical protein
MTLSNGLTKRLKWHYGTRVSSLYEVNDHSVYNRLIARVQYQGGAFVTFRNHKTDLASDELIKEHCEDTRRSMEQWIANEVAEKLN